MGDHTEVVQLDFDPEELTYAELLAEFWREHRPVRPAYKRQYRSVILCSDPAQLELAGASVRAAVERLGQPVHTSVETLRVWAQAEDYHQKYYLRHHATLWRAVAGMAPQALVDSTLAARLNAQAAGYSAAHLRAELERLGALAPTRTESP